MASGFPHRKCPLRPNFSIRGKSARNLDYLSGLHREDVHGPSGLGDGQMRSNSPLVAHLILLALSSCTAFAVAAQTEAAAPVNSAGATKPADDRPIPAKGVASDVAERIDELLAQETGPARNSSVGKVDDETFARRAYLDIIGQWPSAAELTAFVLDPAGDKRAKLATELLDDSRYGRNWGRYWRDVILYRRAEDRALLMTNIAADYFAEVLNVNATWDAVATEIITASGDVSEDGSTVLFMSQMGDPNEVAAEVSRIFLGVQISCAQCHDHKTDRWKREQFHELAAFFPRATLRPEIVDGQQRSFVLFSRDFGPRELPPGVEVNQRFRPIEHFMPDMENPAARGTLMQPAFFLTGAKLPEYQSDMERRHALARWITSPDNLWFARAFVNRIWSELVGEGFYEPIDDIGPDRKPTAPQTLEYLAGEFTAHGYDVKWLFRTILTTEAYQRQSRPRRNETQPAFAANCAGRIRGDQLYDSLMNALGLPTGDEQTLGGYANPRAAFGSPRAQFNRAFGYDPSSPRVDVTGSIPQALLLMNSPNVAAGINGRSSATTLGKLLADDRSDESVVVELYLRCLAREPNAKELAVCLDYVKETGNRPDAFEDVLWSIVNSTEFLHRQ